MSTTHSPEVHAHAHPELGFMRKYIFSEDHKIIGIQFLFSTLIFLGIGGLLAMFVRMQLGWPHADLPGFAQMFARYGGRMPPEFYNMLFSMHATIMIFFVIIPILVRAFANLPLP